VVLVELVMFDGGGSTCCKDGNEHQYTYTYTRISHSRASVLSAICVTLEPGQENACICVHTLHQHTCIHIHTHTHTHASATHERACPLRSASLWSPASWCRPWPVCVIVNKLITHMCVCVCVCECVSVSVCVCECECV
jgi:hypothetical protein